MLLGILVLAMQVDATTLNGRFSLNGAQGKRIARNAVVTLYEATEFAPIALATTRTNRSGRFRFDIEKNISNSVFFLSTSPRSGLRYLAILGTEIPESAVINELTTVASSYSMAQFFRTGQISGDPFRLRIASMMYRNIVNPNNGSVSRVLLQSPNADETTTLRLTQSLANLIVGTTRRTFAKNAFLQITTDEYGREPMDIAEGLANLARDPAKNERWIYYLTRFSRAYRPILQSRPDQWTIAIKVNDSGDKDIPFGGTANVAWDSWGYAWIANNVTQGTAQSTNYNMVLRPDGSPADGANGEPVSPIGSGGLLGVGWGVSVDSKDNIWFGNFGWGKPTSQTYPTQFEGGPNGAGSGSVSKFNSSGIPASLNGFYGPFRVQAIEPDIYDNIWMASLGDADNPVGSGVWVFKDGDPIDSVFSLVDPVDAPFGVAPVQNGNAAWMTLSGGLAGKYTSYLTRYRLNNVGELEQTFKEQVGNTLKTVTVDFSGNAWVASQGTSSVFVFSPDGRRLGEFTGGGIFGPWGLAVDGEGHIWVSNFGEIAANSDYNVGRVSKLCGANPASWPPGKTLGDPLTPSTGYTVPSAGDQVLLSNGDPLYGQGAPPSYVPMMRQTAVQIDAAGNLWTMNNWKPRFNIDATVNPGGDGIIIFVGLATPPPSQY